MTKASNSYLPTTVGLCRKYEYRCAIVVSICFCFVDVIACNVYDKDWSEYTGNSDGSSVFAYSRKDDAGTVSGNDGTVWNTRTQESAVIEPGAPECGDGQVTGSELCDTAIVPGSSGACPTACASAVPCMVAELQGAGCHAVCSLKEASCSSGDDCCPSNCSASTDSDCSATCGDGIVQTDRGELCEPLTAASKAAGASVACPTQCPDDGDPCTREALVGSAANCNARCARSNITYAVASDGCCAAGSNANQDSDCRAVCGNNVVEPGEECDGASDCDAKCKLPVPITPTPPDATCADTLTGVTGECRSCLCSSCATEFEACFNSGDTARDTKCATVVKCGLENDCEGALCYCGVGNVSIYGTCLSFAARGVCRSEVEQAAGTSDMVLIFNQLDNMDTPIGRSTAFTDCHVAQCQGC